MTTLRASLKLMAAVWLTCQIVALTGASVMFWTIPVVALAECTCPHGEDGACPMHQKTAAGLQTCLLRSASDSGLTVLTSMLGGVGLVPTTVTLVAPVASRSAVVTPFSSTPFRPSPPDSPPPRA